jgi:hypothetical protein
VKAAAFLLSAIGSPFRSLETIMKEYKREAKERKFVSHNIVPNK